jgi:hypothetical protein
MERFACLEDGSPLRDNARIPDVVLGHGTDTHERDHNVALRRAPPANEAHFATPVSLCPK